MSIYYQFAQQENIMRLPALLLVLLVCVSACGFQLRGAQMGKLGITSISVQSHGANRLSSIVKTELQISGIKTVDSAADAEYTLLLNNESFTRNVLSVSPKTGKEEELELIYTASMAVNQADGKILLSKDTVQVTRDFTFDDDAVLGKFTEEEVLREDLVRNAASQVLRRLQAVLN